MNRTRRVSKEHKYTSARRRAESQKTTSVNYIKLPDGVSFFKPRAGLVVIDILPYVAGKGNPWAEPGQLHWERTFWVHRGVGPENRTFVCPTKTAGERCPICEHRSRLVKRAAPEDEELIQSLLPKERQLFNVIDLKEPDKGVQIWDVSTHLFGKHLDARIRNSEEEDGYDRFFHLQGGLTIRLSLIEKSLGTYSYLDTETLDFRPRKQDYDDDILERTVCLDELLVIPTYQQLEKVFLAQDSVKDEVEEAQSEDEDEEQSEDQTEDEEVHERPAKARAPLKSKGSVFQQEEEEEEDEEEEQDPKLEEEEEPPKKGKKSLFAPDEDEEEERPTVKAGIPKKDEDDEEEEEDDEDLDLEEDDEDIELPDDDDEDEIEMTDDDDDEEEPQGKRGRKRG
jgi:hypothetical protein